MVQPEVTAAARRRKCPDNVVDWDRYVVGLLSEIFSSAKDVILVLETTIMAVRWWPLWQPPNDAARRRETTRGGRLDVG